MKLFPLFFFSLPLLFIKSEQREQRHGVAGFERAQCSLPLTFHAGHASRKTFSPRTLFILVEKKGAFPASWPKNRNR